MIQYDQDPQLVLKTIPLHHTPWGPFMKFMLCLNQGPPETQTSATPRPRRTGFPAIRLVGRGSLDLRGEESQGVKSAR